MFGAKLTDGADLTVTGGEKGRAGGLFAIQGAALKKMPMAPVGEVVAIGKLEEASVGSVLSVGPAQAQLDVHRRPPLYAVAVAAGNRKDDVRLSGALAKLVEEDPGLELLHEAETHQILLRAAKATPTSGWRWTASAGASRWRSPQTIRRRLTARPSPRPPPSAAGTKTAAMASSATSPSRSSRARPRDGFAFAQKITGGVVPKRWIPAVEQGVRDGLGSPLGFPVIDLEVTLLDGSYP